MAFSFVDDALAPSFALQGGLVSRQQVHDVGGTDRLIAARLASRQWTKVRPGVYLLAGSSASPLRAHWAAVLAGGGEAVISHQSAGVHHGAHVREPGVVLTVPHPTHPRLGGVIVHQSTDLVAGHVGLIHGLPVTTPARTFVDLAAVLSKPDLRSAGESLLLSKRVTGERVARLVAELARPGKRGFTKLGEVLDELLSTHGASESALEQHFLTLVRSAGLDEPTPQHPFPGRLPGAHRVDFAYPERKLVVEVDGRTFHSRLQDMVNDRERDMAAAAAGWQVVRIMWETLREDPERVISQLRQVLEQRAA